jgi:hypothetical protein
MNNKIVQPGVDLIGVFGFIRARFLSQGKILGDAQK